MSDYLQGIFWHLKNPFHSLQKENYNQNELIFKKVQHFVKEPGQ